jgi:predicted nucleotidyltransferase
MGLIGSTIALECLIALTQADMTLGQLSKIVRRVPTATSKALRILVEEGVVQRYGAHKSGRYSINRDSPLTESYLQLARHQIALLTSLRVIATASPAIEFAGYSTDRILIVFTSISRSDDQSLAAKEVDRLGAAHGLRAQYLYHDDVRKRQAVDNELRHETQRLEIAYGSLDRSFPDRSRHAKHEGIHLGHPNSSVHLPSKRLVTRLRRQFDLDSIGLFGSAVRSDFRNDSDVDVVVRLKRNGEATRHVIFELKRVLEPIFDRDVDVVVANGLRPEVLRDIARQEIAL